MCNGLRRRGSPPFSNENFCRARSANVPLPVDPAYHNMKDDRDEDASDHPCRAVRPVIEIENRRQGHGDKHDPYGELDEFFSRPVKLEHHPTPVSPGLVRETVAGRSHLHDVNASYGTCMFFLLHGPVWSQTCPFDTIDDVQYFFFRDAKAGSDEFYRVVFRNASVRVSREQLQNCQVTGTWTYDKTSPLLHPFTLTQIPGVRLGHRAWGLPHAISIEHRRAMSRISRLLATSLSTSLARHEENTIGLQTEPRLQMVRASLSDVFFSPVKRPCCFRDRRAHRRHPYLYQRLRVG